MKKTITCIFTLLASAAFSQQPGDLDLTFGAQGMTYVNESGYGRAMAIQPDDKIIIAGGTSYFGASRFMPNGELDLTFSDDGVTQIDLGNDHYVYDALVQPDGKILLAGYVNDGLNQKDFALIRLTPDGALDTSFNGNGKLFIAFGIQEDDGRAIALQPDGKILITGYAFMGTNKDLALARINPDGTFDTSFSGDGKVTVDIQGSNDNPTCIAVQADGKIVVGGFFYNTSILYCAFGAVRFTTTGVLDTTFSGDGIVTVDLTSHNDQAHGIAIQPDGKIVLVGESDGVNVDFSAVRLTTAGVLDTSFSGDGKFTTPIGTGTDEGHGVAIQADGKILIGGVARMGSYEDIGLVRLTPDGNLDTTFGGDGKINAPVINGITTHKIALQSTGKIIVVGGSSNYNMFAARFHPTQVLGIDTIAQNAFSFYPNPATHTIQCHNNVTAISVFAQDGKKVMDATVAAGQADISGLATGIYILRMTTADGKVSQQKIIIE